MTTTQKSAIVMQWGNTESEMASSEIINLCEQDNWL